jgi:hypothetical protein
MLDMQVMIGHTSLHTMINAELLIFCFIIVGCEKKIIGILMLTVCTSSTTMRLTRRGEEGKRGKGAIRNCPHILPPTIVDRIDDIQEYRSHDDDHGP